MKPEIARLYESGTLGNVMKSMAEQGFNATPKQYKDRIGKWGLNNKNIHRNDYEYMIKKREERQSGTNKQTGFRVGGRLVKEEKIQRYIRDHPKDLTDDDVDMDRNLSPADTPARISYYTPSDTGPLSPQVPRSSQTSLRPHSDIDPRRSVNSQLSSHQSAGSNVISSDHSNSYVNEKSNDPPTPPQGLRGFDHGVPQDYQGHQGYSFQYSDCTGRRKAVLIGINYFGQRGQLRGCVNDVKNMSAFLHENFGYQRNDMVILTDDQQNPMSQPTKQNILRAMHWLVKDAQPNDSLFFHYSGHGGQTKDLDGDEEDGYDEVIYPVDFRQLGHIVDDEMHRILIKSLQTGVRLTAVFDSCHSGTALDLPYIYSTQGVLKEPNLAKEAGEGLLGVISAYSQNDLGGVANNLMGFFEKATAGDEVHSKTLATKTAPADVIMWSNDGANQISPDVTTAKQATGAISWAFITALRKKPEQSYCQLLNSIRDELATKYTQRPQLSCNHPLTTNLLFVM